MPFISICQAIAREEGFYVHGTRASRNNNPGNIVFGNYAKVHGASGTDGRFAIFPTAEDGFRAMADLIEAHYSELTVAQAISKWAPSNENNTEAYIHNVCLWTGLNPSTVIKPYISTPYEVPKTAPNISEVVKATV